MLPHKDISMYSQLNIIKSAPWHVFRVGYELPWLGYSGELTSQWDEKMGSLYWAKWVTQPQAQKVRAAQRKGTTFFRAVQKSWAAVSIFSHSFFRPMRGGGCHSANWQPPPFFLNSIYHVNKDELLSFWASPYGFVCFRCSFCPFIVWMCRIDI